MLAVLCIIGGGAVVNCALSGGVAWAQLSPWTDSNGDLYPTDNENVIVGGTTEATADIYLDAEGNAVFNEQSNEVDFRVESDDNANMLFVDGSNDYIGIGTSSPSARLHLYESGSGFLVPTNTYWMIQNSGASSNGGWLGIIAGAAGKVGLWMGDDGVPEAGTIAYDNSTDNLELDAQDDIVLDGDEIDIDGGQEVNRSPVSTDDYQSQIDDYYIAYTNIGGSWDMHLMETATANTGKMYYVGVEGNAGGGTLEIENYNGTDINGDHDLDAVGDLILVFCTGANSWMGYQVTDK